MDYLEIIFFLIIMLFGFVSIKFDFKTRKVPNYISFPFVIISFLLFLFSIDGFVWLDFLILFLSILGVFYIYKKNIFGAGDGKILLGIVLILMSYGKTEMLLNFVVNVLIFYLLSILTLVMLRTKYEEKIKQLKKYNFNEEIFLMLFVFLLVSLIFSFLPISGSNLLVMVFVFVGIILLIGKVRIQLRPHLKAINSDEMLFMSFLMFSVLVFVAKGESFIYVFFVILTIRILTNLVSNLSEKAGKTKKKYYSPFTLYMFAAALFTMIVDKSIIVIITLLFL